MALPRSIVEYSNTGVKGLVPTCTETDKTKVFLRGDGVWQQISADGQDVSVTQHWEGSIAAGGTSCYLWGKQALPALGENATTLDPYDYHIILGSAIVNPSDVTIIRNATTAEQAALEAPSGKSNAIFITLAHSISVTTNMALYYWPLTENTAILNHDETNTSQTAPASIYAVSKVNTKAVAALPKAGGTANAMTGPLVVKSKTMGNGGASVAPVSIFGDDSTKELAIQAGNYSGAGLFLHGNDATTYVNSADNNTTTTSTDTYAKGCAVLSARAVASDTSEERTEVTIHPYGNIHLTATKTTASGTSDSFSPLIYVSHGTVTDSLDTSLQTKKFSFCAGEWDHGATLSLYNEESTQKFGGAFALSAMAKIVPSGITSPPAINAYNCYMRSFWGDLDGNLGWDGNALQTSSDARLKDNVSSVDTNMLDAWDNVQWSQFKYKDAVSGKQDSARWHIGLVAQTVKEDATTDNADISNYGILCQEQRTEEKMWSIRYEEALAMEAAYQRRKNQQLQAQIDELKAQVQALTQQITNNNANNGE